MCAHCCRCEVGYGLVGVSVRSCQADGTWSGVAPTCESKPTQQTTLQTLPNSPFLCTVSSCGNLEPPQKGNIMTTSTVFQGRATYSCIEGYQLVGEAVRICQANSFWSGTAPFCTSKINLYQTYTECHYFSLFCSRDLWSP